VASDTWGDAIGLRMEGQVMKVLHDHFAGARPVAVGGNAPQRPGKGVVGIDNSAKPSGSPTFPARCLCRAERRPQEDRDLRDQSTEASQDCDLSLTGVQAAGPVTVAQLTAPQGAPPAPAGPGMGRFGGPR